MIDQLATLGKVNSIGRDGFIWWIGQIAHKDSWRETNKAISLRGYKGNRVKVRIVGYHPFDDEGNELPDEDLPWAEVLADPYTGNGQGGLSETLNLVGGEMAIGFFLDGEDAQQPMIMNLFPKYDNVINTFKGTEMKSRKSSGFNAFEAYTRPRPGQPEGEPAHVVINKKKDNQDTKSKVDSNKIVSSTVNDKKRVIHDNSNAFSGFERDATTTTTAQTPCKNDSIDKVSGLVADFIEITKGLETAGDSWIDPLTNTVIDMQAQLEFVKGEVSGIMRSTMNDMKNALMKKINKKFKKVTSDLKLNDPKGLFKEKNAKKAGRGIGKLIACAFGAALGNIGNFIKNMFKNLLGKVINGAVCAIKEFTAGIFSKMFNVLEGALGTIMSGLNWLVGGLSSVMDSLKSASAIASKILGYIKGCDDEACAKPTQFASNIGVTLRAPDSYADSIGRVNFLSGISTAGSRLIRAGRGGQIRTGINSFFGVGNDDEPIGGLTLFDDGDFLFPDCATTNANPTSQADITPTRPGFIYPKCIPPDYQVVGSGTGAELFIVVGNDRRIFSVEVINGGSGYGVDTQITIIDNTGNGHGANVKPIIKDGVIVETVILSTGSGYCLNTIGLDSTTNVGVGTNVVGTVSDVYVITPGVNYDPSDTITFEGVDDGTNIPIITTPSGSIAGVNFPPNVLTEFDTPPTLVVNSDTGSGASFIPIMTFKGQFKTDVDADKRKASPLIGIDHVVDCIGDNRDPVGFVNGVEYSGPYHVMSSGLKMTGASHSGADSIIYDTIQESISDPSVSPSSYTSTETVTQTPVQTTTTTVDTTPTIVTTPTTPTTPTTTTDTSSGTSTPTPPSDGGGGYGGGY